MAADCKSAGESLRGFKSLPCVANLCRQSASPICVAKGAHPGRAWSRNPLLEQFTIECNPAMSPSGSAAVMCGKATPFRHGASFFLSLREAMPRA